MKNLASGEGATLETIAIHAGVFVCVCVSLQLIPVQLALRRGFQNPPAGRWLRGGMDRRGKGERGLMGGRKIRGKHAATH